MSRLAQLQWRMITFMLVACLAEGSAQASRVRPLPERKISLIVQAGLGLPELYGAGVGLITDEKWILSLMASGVMLRETGFRTATGIGVQVAKPFKSDDLFDVLPLPNSFAAQTAYLFATPRVGGDGMAAAVYVGYQNPDRVGMNTYSYVGVSMSAARGYRPLIIPSLKIGLNYNIASQE